MYGRSIVYTVCLCRIVSTLADMGQSIQSGSCRKLIAASVHLQMHVLISPGAIMRFYGFKLLFIPHRIVRHVISFMLR